MNKTAKRCFFASATMHLFLIALLVLGAAFISPKPNPIPSERVRFIPSTTLDSLLSGGGGNPNIARTDDVQKGVPHPVAPVAPPPVEKPVIKPQVKPVTPPTPAPTHEKVEPVKPKVDKKTPTLVVEKIKPTKKEPVKEAKTKEATEDKLDLKPVVRTNEAKKKAQEKARMEAEANEARETAKKWADLNNRLAKVAGKAQEHMQQGFESGTKIEVWGSGGPAYANYASLVQALYDDAWQIIKDLSDDNCITKVSITIARDGTVTSARIIKRSGNSSMDKSVQKALDRVKSVPPFPEGSTDSERTFIINFNLEAKRLIG